MANPFDGLVQPTSLFDSLKPQEDAPSVASPEHIDRTARLAAIANTDVLGNNVGAEVEALTDQYRQQIELSGDGAIRAQAAAKQRQDQLEALLDIAGNTPEGIDPDGSLRKGAQAASLRVIDEDVKEREHHALEQQAVEHIQDLASTDRTQAKVLLNNLELGGPEDVVRDMNVKRLQLDAAIEAAQIMKEDQPWFRDALDFVMTALPLNYSAGAVGNVKVDKPLEGWLDSLFPGKRVRNEASSLWNLSPADFSRVLREEVIPAVKENSTLFGYFDKTEQLNHLTQLRQTSSEGEINTYALMDNLGGIGTATALKAAVSIPTTMIKLGARREAAGLAARAMQMGAEEGVEQAAKRTGVTAADLEAHTMPSAVNPNPATTVPIAGDTAAVIERADKLIQELPELLKTQRFATEAERGAAVATAVDRLSTEFGRELKDVNIVKQDLSTGTSVSHIEFMLGKKAGGGFATEKAANQYLAGIGEVGLVVKDESGQFFVKLSKDLPETGAYTIGLNPAQGTFMGLQAGNPVLDTILNARLVGDKLLADMASAGGNRLNKILKGVIEPKTKTIQKMTKGEKDSLAQIAEQGRKNRQWFDEDELRHQYERNFNRAPSAREIDAYEAFRDASDIEWMYRNDAELYMPKLVRGFETVSLDTGRGITIERENALVSRILDRVSTNDRVYNIVDGLHYGPKNKPLTKEVLEQLQSQGYVLVRYEKSVKLPDGTLVKSFLAKGKDLKIEPLRRDQLAYNPGGHTFYKEKYFSKQTAKEIQPDTREEYFKNPKTHIAGTKAEVDWWNGRMEQARLAYKAGANADDLDEILGNHPGLPDGDYFIKAMERGEFEADQPFLTLYDRELPPEYKLLDPDAHEFGDEAGINGWLRTNGRMYYSPRGDQLPDWRGNLSPTLDVYEAINTSLNNIAQLSSFADYKISAVERWVKTYGPYLRGYKPGASDMSKFVDGQLLTDPQFIKAKEVAEKQRDLIRRTLGWKTANDMKADQMQRSITEWAMGGDPESLRHTTTAKLINWWDHQNPVQSLRGFAFDLKLGLGNVVQLPLQMSTLAVITSLAPKAGFHGTVNYFGALRPYLTKAGTEHMLEEQVKRGVHSMAGFKNAEEYKAFMRSTKASGFLDIGGTHQLIGSYGPNAALSSLGSGQSQLRSKMRFFFNEGEMANRGVAMHVAWKETREKFPELSYKSEEFLRRWQGRAEDYSMSMSQQSSAYWQNGVLSIPTQFWAYQARVMEALLGNTFTPQQRWRLAAGQFLLYGAAGIPLAPLISDHFKEESGMAPQINSILGLMDRGLMDQMWYHITGQDVQVSKRFGTGSWASDTVKDFLGLSQFGKKSAADLFGGATSNILFKGLGDMGRVLENTVKYAAAESGGDTGVPINRDDIMRLADNVSTVSNAHKAYMVWKYNTYISGKGQILASDVPSATAFHILLFGAQPGKLEEMHAHSEYLKNKDEAVQEAAKVFLNYRQKQLSDPDTDYSQEVSLYSKTLPDDVRRKALKRVHRDTPDSLYDGIKERYERTRAQEDMIEEMAQ